MIAASTVYIRNGTLKTVANGEILISINVYLSLDCYGTNSLRFDVTNK